MVWGLRLDNPAEAELSCDELYERYRQAKERGVLPATNIANHEYWTL